MDDYQNNSTGLLDSDNTYVTEYLLKVAKDLQPSVFFQRIQAGFVMSYQEPALSFCALTNETLNIGLNDLIGVLYNYSVDTPTPPECENDIERCNDTDDTCACKDSLQCLGEHPPNTTALPAGYYNHLNYDFQMNLNDFMCLPDYSCDLGELTSKTGQIYPVQKNSLTATVWYNNEVSNR